MRSEFLEALDAATQMLELANSLKYVSMQIEANQALGLINYFLGQPQISKSHLDKVIELDVGDRDRSFIFKSGQDASISTLVFAGLTYWIMGDTDKAEKYSKQGLDLARERGHPFSLAYALNFVSWLSYMQGNVAKTKLYAQEEIDVSIKHEFFWLHKGRLLLGWAIAQSDNPDDIEEGHNLIKNGFHAYKEPGARLGQTLQMAIDANICLRKGTLNEGLEIIEDGLQAVEDTGEVFWHAELLRLKAEMLTQSNTADAMECFQLALTVAEQQGATSLVQRVTESLEKFKADRKSA